MSGTNQRFPRVKKGDILTGEMWNDLVDSLERIVQTGRGSNVMVNSAGVFQREVPSIQTTTTITSAPVVAKEGFLDEAIAASTSNGTIEKTATMSIWSGDGAAWSDTGNDLIVTNRSDDLSASSGTYFVVYLFGTEWRPLWANCG